MKACFLHVRQDSMEELFKGSSFIPSIWNCYLCINPVHNWEKTELTFSCLSSLTQLPAIPFSDKSSHKHEHTNRYVLIQTEKSVYWTTYRKKPPNLPCLATPRVYSSVPGKVFSEQYFLFFIVYIVELNMMKIFKNVLLEFTGTLQKSVMKWLLDKLVQN